MALPWLKGRLLLALIFSILSRIATGLSINYCSSQLTAGGFDPVTDKYQSNGSCQDTCKGQYAFAILKGNQCWCSDYAPGVQGSTSSCNTNCPGFPFEQCGNPNQNLYAYFQINNNVAGTQALSTAAPTTRAVVALDTVTVRDTVTNGPSPLVSVSLSVITASPEPQSTDSPSDTPTPVSPTTASATVIVISTPTLTPTPFASITTVLGSIQTIIVTPSPPPQAAQTNTTIVDAPAPDTFWSDGGKVAGTFVAVALVIIAAVAAAIFFMVRRMRRRNDAIAVGSNADEDVGSGTANPYMVDRRRSNLTLTTNNVGGLTRGSSNEHKPGSQENTPATVSRRTSMPLVHDQRLNPAALWNPAHDNGSHVSVGSFRDDRDYSRPVLHVRNPDAD